MAFGGASLLLTRRRSPLFALAAPYALGAVLSALTIGKVGSNVNYLLELCAASSLAGGIVVAWSRQHVSAHVLRALYLLHSGFPSAAIPHLRLALVYASGSPFLFEKLAPLL